MTEDKEPFPLDVRQFSSSSFSSAIPVDDDGETPIHPPGRSQIFSFSAGGWFQMYHFGVAAAIRDAKVINDSTMFVGTSAGSLAASALAGQLDIEAMRDFALECGDHVRESFWHLFRMKEYVVAAVHRFGRELMSRDQRAGTSTVRERLKKTIEIYITVMPWMTSRALNDFENIEDAEEALAASCCLAPLVGLPFRLKKTKEWVVDGGITAFQPRNGEKNVITVSPFYFSSAHIKPSVFVPVWWAVRPPKREDHRALYDLGYNDAIEFLIRTRRVDRSAVSLLREQSVEIPRRGRFVILKDLLLLFTGYVFLRPFAILLVYVEMVILSVVYFAFALTRPKTRGVALHNLYETIRNIFSFRTILGLFIGSKISFNEERLERRSASYRFFEPLVFPRKERKKRASGKPRFKTDHINIQTTAQKVSREHPNVMWVKRKDSTDE